MEQALRACILLEQPCQNIFKKVARLWKQMTSIVRGGVEIAGGISSCNYETRGLNRNIHV
jgi:hypothetical protein